MAAEISFTNWLIQRYDTKARKPRAIEHGSKIKIEYQPVYDVNGVWHLEPSGKNNTYMEIQSHADSCDINLIMARYRNGETDILSRIQGVYGDVTNVPTNYSEIMNQQLKAEQLFMSLAPDVREKYNNSVEQFMASFSTKEGWEAIGFKFDSSPSSDGSEAPNNGSPEVTSDGT